MAIVSLERLVEGGMAAPAVFERVFPLLVHSLSALTTRVAESIALAWTYTAAMCLLERRARTASKGSLRSMSSEKNTTEACASETAWIAKDILSRAF